MNEIITRHIDDLGRVLIPKEIRRKLRINEGDPLFISEQNGTIVIEKNLSIKNVIESVSDYVKSVADVLDCNILITDLNEVLFETNLNSKHLNHDLDLSFVATLEKESKDGIFCFSYKLRVVNLVEKDEAFVVGIIKNKDQKAVGSVILYANDTPIVTMQAKSIAATIMSRMGFE